MVEATFWIRVFDLPLTTRNECTDRLIGNSLGKFKEIDLDNGEVEWVEFMHLRITLDITRPLLRRKKLNTLQDHLDRFGCILCMRDYLIFAFVVEYLDTVIRNASGG